MDMNLKPISLNDQGGHVTVLHQALAALRLPVSANEVTQRKAGDSTLKQVRALQKQLGIRVAASSVLLDEKTIVAMVKAMTEKGLLSANHVFDVSGKVELSNGSLKKAQRLIAFDLDLHGVSLYRKLESLKQVVANGGFEYLGEVTSDNKGQYKIRFYDWQYSRAERKLADVVVYAVTDKNDVIGRSRLVNTSENDNGFVSDLDILLTSVDERTEYQALMDPLNAFLQQSKSSLVQIALSNDQLDFTASELDIDRFHLGLAATAALAVQDTPKLSHELLYGITRQDISLSWAALFKKKQQEILSAIARSVDDGIISEFSEAKVTQCIAGIQSAAILHILDDKDDGGNNALSEMLSNGLPEKPQQVAFLNALSDFNGSDFSKFWNTHLPAQPAFNNKPELVAAIQLTQQLTEFTGNHQPLVKALQLEKGIKSAYALVDFTANDWFEVVKETGVPDAVEGKDENEKQQRYADIMRNQVNATFPTHRIAKMVKDNQLGIDNAKVAASIGRLFANEKFDIAKERVHDFQPEIEVAAELDNVDPEEVKHEAMKLQRVFQVSTNPDVMTALLKNNLHSAYTIASFPRKNFVKTYSKALGGEMTADAVHQRAEFISTRIESIAMDVKELADDAATPIMAKSKAAFVETETVFKTNFPNYKNLFGSPDLCECQHCRSVYSPAAYFVDLLRFMQRSTFEFELADGTTESRSPYDYLVGRKKDDAISKISGRRPDLAELALSCENTNTLIPYIDLANEVMESYVAAGSLQAYKGENTGDAKGDELRANPQHTSIDAYRILSDSHPNKSAKYPFSLPYHLPLDMIRTYSDFLGVSRYEVMQSVGLNLHDETSRAIASEALFVSPAEYSLLVGESFVKTPDNTEIHELFGLSDSDDLEKLSPVQECMDRSGIAYIELVELVKTDFINPNQDLLEYLEKLFSRSLIDGPTLYNWLENAAVDGTSLVEDLQIDAALQEYNSVQGTEDAKVELSQLKQWASDHFSEFQQVITLFEPTSSCSLHTTRLRVIQSIYEDPDKLVLMANLEEKLVLGSSGITADSWSRLHRFIRLWRKTGWSIHETDLMLNALDEGSISPTTIKKLEPVLLLKKESRLPVNQLAVLWGNIDTYGKQSLYKKLFLNKSVQQIDNAFVADAQGNYLLKERDVGGPITLVKHQSTILAAFRISEDELRAIVALAEIDIINDVLNIQNLSAIYRYVVLAKALKLRVTDVCKLIVMFNASPFGANSSPSETYEFYQLAASTKRTKFKPKVLDYIFNGDLPADSKLGLDTNKALLAAKAIRDSLDVIDQNHQEVSVPILTLQTPEALETLEALAATLSLTPDILVAKLSLTFEPTIVNRLMEIINGTAVFDVITKTNLNIANALKDNHELGGKFSYIEASGRLSCIGVMSDDERTQLITLTGDNEFEISVAQLHAAPEAFINTSFDGVLSSAAVTAAIAEGGDVGAARAVAQATTMAVLLDRHNLGSVTRLDAKLAYVYKNFLPVLKQQLQQNMITSQVADLVGLNEDIISLLLAEDIDDLVSKLSTQGLSAIYFNNTTFDEASLPKPFVRTDSLIDFVWIKTPADKRNLPVSDSFSVRWETYIAAPASGEYTLIVEVAEKDEAFNLFLDGELAINKEAGDDRISFETVVKLNASQLHLLILEYVENSGSAGIKLRWKTVTSAPQVIPATVAYPAQIQNDFVQQASLLHRAAMFIQGFKISGTELKHFITFNEDFADINFKKLEPEHWIRIRDYAALRNSVPQAGALLTDIFTLSKQPIPVAAEAQLIDKIHLDLVETIHYATAWDKGNISGLIDYFTPQFQPIDFINSFKNEITLNRFYTIISIAEKTGLSAEAITRWGVAETDFDALHTTAQLLKNAVKAKYTQRQWLELAGGLSDKLRANQKQALISYLLVQASIINADVKDADGLYEHLLIDVQMGACMDTSRIVQANAAIQLFVNRILLNLETDISPNTIDTNRWQWMKNYRVWEANRKVFLYPENWLAPEWRNDRSEFFKDLESHLLQNDITKRSVEQGLRNYLMSLNEVANLDVCGMHQENYDDGKLKYLHVFGRTHNLPYKYFYRRWNEHQKWSAWGKVQVDIRSVEGVDNSGKNSGVHLIPVVWKGRLFLFWPEFMEKAKAAKIEGSLEKAGSEPAAALEPKKYWEIRLAWSEYVDGTWSPKQVSKEYLTTGGLPSEVRIHPHFENDENSLDKGSLIFLVANDHIYGMYFAISDIHSPIMANNDWCKAGIPALIYYKNKYLKLVTENKPLQSPSLNKYLKAKKDHELLKVNGALDMEFDSSTSFFYSEGHRTYFVSPKENGVTVNSLDNKIASNLKLADDGASQLRGHDFLALMNDDGWHSNTPVFTDPMIISDPHFGGDDGVSGRRPVLGDFVNELPCTFIIKYGKPLRKVISRRDQSLNFHTFHHPYAGEYVRRLNQSGLSALMGINTDKSFDEADDDIIFEKVYDPVFDIGRVNKMTDSSHTAYQENICFDVYGANSQYNWELFFHAPLYIATRLSKNGKFAEAMKWFHYVFDPTTSEKPESENDTARYWKVRPFKNESNTVESLESWFKQLEPNSDHDNPGNAKIDEWRKNPFDPHLVASNRPIAYMKHVVIKYIENLIDWGDSLFRQFTRESVYEAIQLYVIASHVLGKRPEFVPKRGEIKTETYASLKENLDDFGNVLIELENIFPYTSTVNLETPSPGSNLLGIGEALYFCIPANEKMLGYWDTVADRLFKIRHCQDLDGVERNLALFAPAIDPAALIQARSQGLSLGSILADLSSPPPIYRFVYLLQKANEFCNDVKSLGSAVLSAIEKKDGEELSRLRASQETDMLERVTAIRERQVLSAKAGIESLLKSRETAALRLEHYNTQLLGNDSITLPDSPTLDATLTANGPLPVDTSIALIDTNADMSLVGSDESGVKLTGREADELRQSNASSKWQVRANLTNTIGSSLYFIPEFQIASMPFGLGGSVTTGGQSIGASSSATASAFSAYAASKSINAQKAGKFAGYIRRTYDWTFQANLVIREIIQLDKQITSADIQLQIAEKELQNHHQQIENSKQTELFLKDKFTNQELYQWMKEQLFLVYKQSYNLAFEMAKKAEKAYQYEFGTDITNFIQYGYWDNSMQGLVAGEKLQLGLRQLENSFLNDNRRELELSKSVSLAMLNPLALIELRETGKCHLSLPEEVFDLDFQGHFFRRIKAVSLSIPCIAGPYTTVNCSLRLLKNSMRKNTLIPDEYEHNNDEGLPLDDDRFCASNVPVTLIATSTGQNDAGMFEFNFRDERYLPFEGAGVISDWMIELSTEKEFRQFDYETISDVILHLKYTAKESSGVFKEKAVEHLHKYLKPDEGGTTPSSRMFNLKQNFPTEWHRFLHPTAPTTDNIFDLAVSANLFPLLDQDQTLQVNKIWVLARCTNNISGYEVVIDPPIGPEKMVLQLDEQFGSLFFSSRDISDMPVEIKSENSPTIWKLKMSHAGGDNLLVNEVEDVFLVLEYQWKK